VNEGKVQELEDAISRLQQGHGVALGGGGADVMDYTKREAIQHKRIFGNASIKELLAKAAYQLQGDGGEVPPEGFKRIIDIRFDPSSKNPMRDADKNMLRKLFPLREDLDKVDLVKITTDRGIFEFTPPFPLH
jgi:hypothetical protein